MSLHGTIYVNNSPIGGWTARRLEDLRGHEVEHEYEVEVQMWASVVPTGTVTARVMHRYSDGALVLARKVLEAAT